MPMLRQCKQLYRPQRHLSLDLLVASIGGVFLRLSIIVVYFGGCLMLRSTHDEKAQRTQEKTRLNALDVWRYKTIKGKGTSEANSVHATRRTV